jgi:monosaccharide-transporting ATPase
MAESNGAIVTMEGISKSFPGVQALENVDFTLRKGEIHALVGENGAGKSTLIKVMTGAERQDKGSIRLEDRETVIRSPRKLRSWASQLCIRKSTSAPTLRLRKIS